VAQIGGEIILHKIISSGVDINGKAQKEAWEKLMAYLFMEQAQGVIWITVVCFEAGTFIQAGSISYNIGTSSSDAEPT